jgi:hypothetical protein
MLDDRKMYITKIPAGVDGLWVVWTIRICSCLGAVPFIIIVFGQRIIWWECTTNCSQAWKCFPKQLWIVVLCKINNLKTFVTDSPKLISLVYLIIFK